MKSCSKFLIILPFFMATNAMAYGYVRHEHERVRHFTCYGENNNMRCGEQGTSWAVYDKTANELNNKIINNLKSLELESLYSQQ